MSAEEENDEREQENARVYLPANAERPYFERLLNYCELSIDFTSM